MQEEDVPKKSPSKSPPAKVIVELIWIFYLFLKHRLVHLQVVPESFVSEVHYKAKRMTFDDSLLFTVSNSDLF